MGLLRSAEPRRLGGAPRMGMIYAAAYGGTGVSLPFISPWFAAHGLNGADISAILAAPLLARLVTSPLVAVWADSWRLRRTPIAVLALVAAAGYLALGFGRGIAVWLPVWFAASTAMSSIPPLADVLTLRCARHEGFQFGAPRGMGSLAFLLANALMGALLAKTSINVVPLWITAAAALLAGLAFTLAPPEPVRERGERLRSAERFKGVGRLLADPNFLIAIVSIGLIQATHAFYYAFSTLVWKAQGIAAPLWGLLWATGIVAEIVFLWFMQPLVSKAGPWALLMLGGAGAVARWTAFALSPPLWLLFPLQLFHGLSFAASYIAGLQIIERLTPPDRLSAGQTLNSALSAGVLIGLATVFSGPLFDRYGALGYLAMSVLAALGLVGGVRLRQALAEAR